MALRFAHGLSVLALFVVPAGGCASAPDPSPRFTQAASVDLVDLAELAENRKVFDNRQILVVGYLDGLRVGARHFVLTSAQFVDERDGYRCDSSGGKSIAVTFEHDDALKIRGLERSDDDRQIRKVMLRGIFHEEEIFVETGLITMRYPMSMEHASFVEIFSDKCRFF